MTSLFSRWSCSRKGIGEIDFIIVYRTLEHAKATALTQSLNISDWLSVFKHKAFRLMYVHSWLIYQKHQMFTKFLIKVARHFFLRRQDNGRKRRGISNWSPLWHCLSFDSGIDFDHNTNWQCMNCTTNV